MLICLVKDKEEFRGASYSFDAKSFWDVDMACDKTNEGRIIKEVKVYTSEV